MVPPSSLKRTSAKPARSTAAASSSAPGKRRTLAGRYAYARRSRPELRIAASREIPVSSAHLVENEFVKGEWQSELVYAILERGPPGADGAKLELVGCWAHCRRYFFEAADRKSVV